MFEDGARARIVTNVLRAVTTQASSRGMGRRTGEVPQFVVPLARRCGLSFSAVARLVREICELAGLHVLHVHPRKSSGSFRQRWRTEFAESEVDWRGVRYDWERLGTEFAPAFEKRRAIREYERRRSEAETALVARWVEFEEVSEVRGALPEYAWWRGHVGASDLFVVHGEWLWSFVMTHEEEGLGIGPFFVDRLQALL